MNRITVIIIGLLLLLLSLLLGNKVVRYGSRLDKAQQNIALKDQEIELIKTREGNWKTKALSIEGDLKTLEISHQKELKELEGLFNVKVKHLESALSMDNQTEITIGVKPDSVLIVKKDTVYLEEIFFHDYNPWYRIQGSTTISEVSIDLLVFDSISVVSYWKREGLFKDKTLQIEAISHNPYTKVTGLDNISVQGGRVGRFSVGPYIGIGISQSLTPSLQVGVGVQYSLLRF